MILVKIIRPNTVGTTFQREFDTYPEDFIERRVEKLCDNGWEATELSGSTTKSGTIELTHDYEADIMLITWETI